MDKPKTDEYQENTNKVSEEKINFTEKIKEDQPVTLPSEEKIKENDSGVKESKIPAVASPISFSVEDLSKLLDEKLATFGKLRDLVKCDVTEIIGNEIKSAVDTMKKDVSKIIFEFFKEEKIDTDTRIEESNKKIQAIEKEKEQLEKNISSLKKETQDQKVENQESLSSEITRLCDAIAKPISDEINLRIDEKISAFKPKVTVTFESQKNSNGERCGDLKMNKHFAKRPYFVKDFKNLEMKYGQVFINKEGTL